MKRRRQHHNIVIQARDIAILKELVESRAVTTRHFAQLFFNGSDGAARKRLRLMRQAGWINVRTTTPGTSDLLQLTRSGYQLLTHYETPALEWPQVARRQRVNSSMLQHELAVMDTNCALARTSQLMGFTTIRPDRYLRPRIRSRGSHHSLPYPDAHLQLEADTGVGHFFLELDNGTQRLSTIQEKVQAYRDAVCVLPAGTADAPAAVPFRILFVCRTLQRRDNLASCMLAMTPPVRRFCVLVLLDDLSRGRVDDRWITPDMLEGI